MSYCKTARSYLGHNRFWIAENNIAILDIIQKKKNTIKHIRTYDFSTLYTNIPHAQLKNRLRDIVLKAFVGKNTKYINIYNSSVRWTTVQVKENSKTVQIDAEMLIDMINYSIDNICNLWREGV